MKIWINKSEKTELSHEFRNAFIFNMLNEPAESNVRTDFEKIWRKFSKENLASIYEDFLVIAASVFTIDKRIPRDKIIGINDNDISSNDNWTRTLDVCIPVIEIEKWNSVKNNLEEILNFLSGDKWSVSFRETNKRYRSIQNTNQGNEVNTDFDCISLFSGGLDSFSGAIKLLSGGKKACFVGCMEYNQLNKRISDLHNIIKRHYSNMNSDIIVFSTKPGIPKNISQDLRSRFSENTSRSRSLLFIAGALAVASLIGRDVPVYIPENGFIGMNIPLTPSRIGSCSTRTTHVFFINNLNKLLTVVGIPHKVSNFYAYKTKGEIVAELKDKPAFIEGANLTISCSHPTQGRIDGATPINCGYCFPCLIRRASLIKIGFSSSAYLDSINQEYKLSTAFIGKYNNPDTGRAKDLKAVLAALYTYINNSGTDYFKNQMTKAGGMTAQEVELFNRVYIESMEELKEMIKREAYNNDVNLLKYVGMSADK